MFKFIVPGPFHTITPTALSEQRSSLCNFLYSQLVGLAIFALYLAKNFPVPIQQGIRQGCTNPRLNFCTVAPTVCGTRFWRLEF